MAIVEVVLAFGPNEDYHKCRLCDLSLQRLYFDVDPKYVLEGIPDRYMLAPGKIEGYAGGPKFFVGHAPCPRCGAQYECTFTIDANGVLSVGKVFAFYKVMGSDERFNPMVKPYHPV